VGVKGVETRDGGEEGVQRVMKGGGREGDEGGMRAEGEWVTGPSVAIHPQIDRAVLPRHTF